MEYINQEINVYPAKSLVKPVLMILIVVLVPSRLKEGKGLLVTVNQVIIPKEMTVNLVKLPVVNVLPIQIVLL